MNDRIYLGSGHTSSLGKSRKNKPRSSNGAKEHFAPNCNVEFPEIPNPKLPNPNGDSLIVKPIFKHPKEGSLSNCSGPIPNLCLPGNMSDLSPTPQTNLEMHERVPYEDDLQINMDWDVEATDGNLNDSFLSSLNLDGIFEPESVDVHEENESGYSTLDSGISVSCSEQQTESEMPAFSDGFDCSLLSFGNISSYEYPLNQSV